VVGRRPLIRTLTVVAGLGVLAGCATDRARLAVELSAPPSVTPLVFHGNCFAGFLLSFDLRLEETGGAALDLSSLSFEVRDAVTAEALGGETLDAAALRDRYGAAALRLQPYASHTFEVGVRVSGPGRRGLTAVGEVSGADSEGLVRQPYRIEIGDVILEEPQSSEGGACSPPPGP
jgi:hypothetical protein